MSLKIINESNDPTIFDVSYKQNDIYQANYVKAYSEEEVKEYFKTKRQDAEYLGATNIGMRSVLKPGKPVIDLTKESNLNEDDARKNKFDFLDSWYGSLDDIIKSVWGLGTMAGMAFGALADAGIVYSYLNKAKKLFKQI